MPNAKTGIPITESPNKTKITIFLILFTFRCCVVFLLLHIVVQHLHILSHNPTIEAAIPAIGIEVDKYLADNLAADGNVVGHMLVSFQKIIDVYKLIVIKASLNVDCLTYTGVAEQPFPLLLIGKDAARFLEQLEINGGKLVIFVNQNRQIVDHVG
jgi:hypothetical protein